jgi:hypothetical protein
MIVVAEFLRSRGQVSGAGRIILMAGLLTGAFGIAKLHAQAVLGDPRDAARIFASNCSACHKSPQGLAKSGQVAGFLRQHYTTGPEMSAAMAAYLVAAGSGPASKKGAASAENAAAKAKGKKGEKGEQLAAWPEPEHAETAKQRALHGKQKGAKASEEAKAREEAPPLPEPRPAAEAKPAVSASLETTQSAPPASPSPAASTQPPAVVLDLPLPPMPEGPPPELSQSVFSSSPLP